MSEEKLVEMARLPELTRFCEKRGYVLASIADLQQYQQDRVVSNSSLRGAISTRIVV